MAIAGHFDLEIYMISLLDIDDSSLIRLLHMLPSSGSLLLLEDIDSAGLDRKLRRKARASRESGTPSETEGEQQAPKVTLSGLLNAIDGISSPEGIVTVMTSNHTEQLDSALIRSGRISVKVIFTYATQAQAQNIFLRQYQKGELHSSEESNTVRKLVPPNKKLLAMAASFAKKVSTDDFSPADLQDYLILHKEEPQRAVDQFDEFKTKTLETRALQADGEKRLDKERGTQAKEAKKQAEAEVPAVTSSLAGSKWAGIKFWG